MPDSDNAELNQGLMPTWKRLFLRGLAALLPTLVTLVILLKLVGFLNNNFGKYIGVGLTHGVNWVLPTLFDPSKGDIAAILEKQGKDIATIGQASYDQLHKQLKREELRRVATSWQMAAIGFVLALVIVCVIGLLLASLVGRRLWRLMESTITRVPVIKHIYPHVKQVTDYVFGQRRMEFSQVVAVQYPRKGIWAMGFITGPAIRSLQELDKDYITVFVPSSPTPLTGYVITVLKGDTMDLPINIDEAFRFLISGGVIRPGMELPGGEDAPTLGPGQRE